VYESYCVCADCMKEPMLKAFVSKRAIDNGAHCVYCKSDPKPVVALEVVTEKIDAVLSAFYVPVPEDSDGEDIYQGTPLRDLIIEWFAAGTSEVIAEHVALDLIESWFDSDEEVDTYGDNPHFAKSSLSPGMMPRIWRETMQKVHFEARYVNPDVISVLDSVFGPVMNDKTRGDASVIVLAGPGQAIEHVYRARVFQERRHLHEALKHPELELGPPPQGLASAGRMNAKGLSMFYGASSEDVAISEVRPPVGSHVLVGCFNFASEMRLLDLTKFADVDLPADFSMFSESAIRQSRRVAFLTRLEHLLTEPAMPDTAERQYLSTQLISDYLATNKNLDLDGIIFRSTQLPGVAGENYNIALFVKASHVAMSSKGYAEKMDGYWHNNKLMSLLDGAAGPAVLIEEGILPPKKGFSIQRDGTGQRSISLLLDRSSLSIKAVKKVMVDFESIPVANETRPAQYFAKSK
jgi:hypothetical protein